MSQPQLFGVPQQDWEVGPATPSIGLICGDTLQIITSDGLHVRNSVRGKPGAGQVLVKPLDAHLGLLLISRGSVMRVVPASLLRQLPNLDELLNLNPGHKTLFLAPLECHVLHTTLRCMLDFTEQSGNSARLPLRFVSACQSTLQAVNVALAKHAEGTTGHPAAAAPSAVGPQQFATPTEVLPVQVHTLSASMAAWCTSVLIGQSPSLLQSGLMSMAHQTSSWPGHIWDQGKFTMPSTRAATWRFSRRSQLSPKGAAGGGVHDTLSSLAQTLLLTTHRSALQALMDAQGSTLRPSAALADSDGSKASSPSTPWGDVESLGGGAAAGGSDSKGKQDSNESTGDAAPASFVGVDPSKMSLAVAITGAAVAGFVRTNSDSKVRHCVSNVMLAHQNLLTLVGSGTSPLGILALLTGEAASWPKAARNLGDIPARHALAAMYTPIHAPWNPLHNLRPDAEHGLDTAAAGGAGDSIVDIVSPCDMLQSCTLPTYSPPGLAAAPGAASIAHGTPLDTQEHSGMLEALKIDQHEQRSGVLRGVPLFATVYSRGSIDVWSRSGVFPVCHAFALQALRPHLYGVQVMAGTPAAAIQAWLKSGNASLGPVTLVPPSCVQMTASGPPPGVDEEGGGDALAADAVLESSLTTGAEFERDVGPDAVPASSIAAVIAAGLSAAEAGSGGAAALAGVHCATAKLHPSMAGLDSVPAPSATVQNSGSCEAVQWCCAGLSVVISKGALTGRVGWVTGVADKKNEQLFVRVLPPLAIVQPESSAAAEAGAAAGGTPAPAPTGSTGGGDAAATVDADADADAEVQAVAEGESAGPSEGTASGAPGTTHSSPEQPSLDLSDLIPGAPAVAATQVGTWERPNLDSFTTIVPVSALKPHRPGASSFARLIKGEHKNARVLVLDVSYGPERLMLCADVATGALMTQRKDKVAAERSFEEVLAAEQRIRDVWHHSISASAATAKLTDIAGSTSSSKPIALYAPVDLPEHDMEQLVNMFASKQAATGLGDLGQVASPVAGRDARVLSVVHHGLGTAQQAVLCLYHRQEVTTHDDATLISPLAADAAVPSDVEELSSEAAEDVLKNTHGWVTRMQQAVTLRGGHVTHVRYESMRRCVVAAWEGCPNTAPAAEGGAEIEDGRLPRHALLSLPLSSASGEVLAAGSACIALPAPVVSIQGVAPWAGCRLRLGLLLALLGDGSIAVCSRGAQVLLHIVPADQVQALIRTAAGTGVSAGVSAVALLDDRSSPAAALHGVVGDGTHQGSPVLAVLCGDAVGLLSVQGLAEWPRQAAATPTAQLLPEWLSSFAQASSDPSVLAQHMAQLSPAQWRSVTAALAPQAGPCKAALTCSAVHGAATAGASPVQLGYEDAEVSIVHRIDGSQEVVFRSDCAKHSSPIPAAGAVNKEHPALACSEWTPAHSFTAGLRLPALTAMHRLFVRACVAVTVRATGEPSAALASALQRDCLQFGGKHAYSPDGGYMLLQLAGRSSAQAGADEYSDIFSALGGRVEGLGGVGAGALALTPPAAPNAALMDVSDDLAAMCGQSEQPIATLLSAQSRGVPLAMSASLPQFREYSKVFSDSDNAMVPTSTNDPSKGWTIEAWVCPDEGTFGHLPHEWNPSAERLDPRSDVCGAALHIQPIVDLGESQGVGVAFPIAPGFSALIRKQPFGLLWRRLGALPDADDAVPALELTRISKWHAVEWGTAVYRRQTDQLPPAFMPDAPGVYEIALMPKPAVAGDKSTTAQKADVDAAFDAAVCAGVFASVPNASLPGDVAKGLRALQQDLPRAKVHSLRTVLETTTGDGSVIAVAVSTAGHVHVVCQHPFMHSVLRYGGEASSDGSVRLPFVPATNGAGASVAALASNLPGDNTVTRPSLTSAQDYSWHGQHVLEAEPPAYDVFAPRIPQGAWSHVALRLHAGTAELSLLVNGRPYSRRSRPNLVCTEDDLDPVPGSGLPLAARHAPTLLRIGGSVLGDTFHGRIANVRVWGNHVPSRQLQRAMHAPLAPAAPAAGEDCSLEYVGLRWGHTLAGTGSSAQYGLASALQRCWPSHSVFAKGKQEHPELHKALSSGSAAIASPCTGPPVDLAGCGLGDAVSVLATVESNPGQGYLADAPLQSAVHASAAVPLQHLGLTHTTPMLNSVARTLRVHVQLRLGAQLAGARAQLVSCHLGATGAEVHSALRHVVEAGTTAADVPRALELAARQVQRISAEAALLTKAAWSTAIAAADTKRATTSSALRLIQRLQQALLDEPRTAAALANVVVDSAQWAAAVKRLVQEASTNEDALLGGALVLSALRSQAHAPDTVQLVAEAALGIWEACSSDAGDGTQPAALRVAGALLAWCIKTLPTVQAKVSAAALSVLLRTLRSSQDTPHPVAEAVQALAELFPASAAAVQRMMMPQWAHLQLHSRPLLVHPHAALANVPRYGAYDQSTVQGAILGAQIPSDLAAVLAHNFEQDGTTVDELALLKGMPGLSLHELFEVQETPPGAESWGGSAAVLESVNSGTVRIACSQLDLKQAAQSFLFDLDAQRCVDSQLPSSHTAAPPTMLTGFSIDIVRPETTSAGTVVVSVDAIPAAAAHHTCMRWRNYGRPPPQHATHCAENLLAKWSPSETLGFATKAQWAEAINSASQRDANLSRRATVDSLSRVIQMRASTCSLLSRPVPKTGAYRYVFFASEAGASSTFNDLLVALCDKEAVFGGEADLGAIQWRERSGLAAADKPLTENSIVISPGTGKVGVPHAFALEPPLAAGAAGAEEATSVTAALSATEAPPASNGSADEAADTAVAPVAEATATAAAVTVHKLPPLALKPGKGQYIALFVDYTTGCVHVDVNDSGQFSLEAATKLPVKLDPSGPPLYPAVGVEKWSSIGSTSSICVQLHDVAMLPPVDSARPASVFADVATGPQGTIRIANIAAGPTRGTHSVLAVSDPSTVAAATDSLARGVSPVSVAPCSSLPQALTAAAGVGGVHMHVPHAHGCDVTGTVTDSTTPNVPTRVTLNGLGSLAAGIGARFVEVSVMLVSGSSAAETAHAWNTEIPNVPPTDVTVDLTLFGHRVPSGLQTCSAVDALPVWAAGASLLHAPGRQFRQSEVSPVPTLRNMEAVIKLVEDARSGISEDFMANAGGDLSDAKASAQAMAPETRATLTLEPPPADMKRCGAILRGLWRHVHEALPALLEALTYAGAAEAAAQGVPALQEKLAQLQASMHGARQLLSASRISSVQRVAAAALVQSPSGSLPPLTKDVVLQTVSALLQQDTGTTRDAKLFDALASNMLTAFLAHSSAEGADSIVCLLLQQLSAVSQDDVDTSDGVQAGMADASGRVAAAIAKGYTLLQRCSAVETEHSTGGAASQLVKALVQQPSAPTDSSAVSGLLGFLLDAAPRGDAASSASESGAALVQHAARSSTAARLLCAVLQGIDIDPKLKGVLLVEACVSRFLPAWLGAIEAGFLAHASCIESVFQLVLQKLGLGPRGAVQCIAAGASDRRLAASPAFAALVHAAASSSAHADRARGLLEGMLHADMTALADCTKLLAEKHLQTGSGKLRSGCQLQRALSLMDTCVTLYECAAGGIAAAAVQNRMLEPPSAVPPVLMRSGDSRGSDADREVGLGGAPSSLSPPPPPPPPAGSVALKRAATAPVFASARSEAADKRLSALAPHEEAVRVAVTLLCQHPLPSHRTALADSADAVTLGVWSTALKVLSAHGDASSGRMDALTAADAGALAAFLAQQVLGAPAVLRGGLSTSAQSLILTLLNAMHSGTGSSQEQFLAALHCAKAAAGCLAQATEGLELLQPAAHWARHGCDTKANTYGQSNTGVIVRSAALKVQAIEVTSRAAFSLSLLQGMLPPLTSAAAGGQGCAEHTGGLAQTMLQSVMPHLQWRLRHLDWSEGSSACELQLGDLTLQAISCTLQAITSMLQSSARAAPVIAHLAPWLLSHGPTSSPLFTLVAWAVAHAEPGSALPFAGGLSWTDVLAGKHALEALASPGVDNISGSLVQLSGGSTLVTSVQSAILRLLCVLAEHADTDTITEGLVASCQHIVRCARSRPDTVAPPASAPRGVGGGSLAAMLTNAAGGEAATPAQAAPISPLGLHETLKQLNTAHARTGMAGGGGFMAVLMLLLALAMRRSSKTASATLSAVMQVLGGDASADSAAEAGSVDSDSSASEEAPPLAPLAAQEAGVSSSFLAPAATTQLQLHSKELPLRLKKRITETLQLQRIVDKVLATTGAPGSGNTTLPDANDAFSTAGAKNLLEFALPLGVPSCTASSPRHKAVFPAVLRMQDSLAPAVKSWSMAGSPVHGLVSNCRDSFQSEDMLFSYSKASLGDAGLGTIAAGGDVRYFTFFVVLQRPCVLSHLELTFADARDVAAPLSVMLHAGQCAGELAPLAHSACVAVPAATPGMVSAYNPQRNSETSKDIAIFDKHFAAPSASQFALLRVHNPAPVQVLMFTCVLSESAAPRRAADVFGCLKHFHIVGTPADAPAASLDTADTAKQIAVVTADGVALAVGATLESDSNAEALNRTVVEPFLDFLGEHMSAAPFLLQGCHPAAENTSPADQRLAKALEARRVAVQRALGTLTPDACVQAASSIWNSMKHLVQAHVRNGADSVTIVEFTGSALLERAVTVLGNLAWHQALVREALLHKIALWLQPAGSAAVGDSATVHVRAVIAAASVQLLPYLLAAHAAAASTGSTQWLALGPLLSQLAAVVTAQQAPSPAYLCALPLLESLSQVLGGSDTRVAACVPPSQLAELVAATTGALARCKMGTQAYKTLLTFICTAFPHMASSIALRSHAKQILGTAVSEAQGALHAATGSHAAFNAVVQGCSFESAGSAAAALAHCGAVQAAACGMASPSTHLPVLAHLLAHAGVVAAGADAFRLVQGAVQLLQWGSAAAADASCDSVQWPAAPTPSPEADTGGEAESKEQDESVRVVGNPLTELCLSVATDACSAQHLCLAVVAMAAHVVAVACDDSSVALWAGKQLVAPILMCLATSGDAKKTPSATCSVLSAVPAALRPLQSVLETLIQSHDSNKELAVSTASEAVAGATTLSPSLLALFRQLSGSTSQSFVSVVPPAGAGLLTPAVLALVKAADDSAHAETSTSNAPPSEKSVPPSIWETDLEATPVQKALGLGQDAAGHAAAAMLVAATKATFTTELISNNDRAEVDGADPRCVLHTGSSNANALVDLPICKGSGVFHVTFRVDALKGDETVGASHNGLCVSFGVSPIKTPDNKALGCASMQYMVDQKDANCYDGSTDVGDYREPAPFMSVGDSITIVIDSNNETFGFFGSNGAMNTVFTQIYARMKDPKFGSALYPAIFFYSAQSGRVTLTDVRVVQPPSNVASDSVKKWQELHSVNSVEVAVGLLGGSAAAANGSVASSSALRPRTQAAVSAVASTQGLHCPIPPQNLIVGADTSPALKTTAPDAFSQAQWSILGGGGVPAAAWRSPLPLLPIPGSCSLDTLAASLLAQSRYVHWQVSAVVPSVTQAQSHLPATGAGGSAAEVVATAEPVAWDVAGVGGVGGGTTVGTALRALAALKHARSSDAVSQLTEALPEGIASALAAVTAGAAAAAPGPVLSMSFAVTGNPTAAAEPAVAPAPSDVDETAGSGGSAAGLSTPTTAQEKPIARADNALRAAVVVDSTSSTRNTQERTMLAWLNEAGILAKLLSLVQADIPRAFGLHPALLGEGGDPEMAPPLPEGTFQHDDEAFAADRGDTWKSVKEVWLEHGASMHSWLRDALALLGNPATGELVASDVTMQGMLQLLLDAYGKLSSVPADVFRGFNMPAKRGGDAHWTALAAQLVPGITVKGFLKPKSDPARMLKLSKALVAAGLSSTTDNGASTGSQAAANGGALLLSSGQQVLPTLPGSILAHPEHGTVALRGDSGVAQAVCSMGRGKASHVGAAVQSLSADATSHPTATLLRPVLVRVFGAARADELLLESATTPAAPAAPKPSGAGDAKPAGTAEAALPGDAAPSAASGSAADSTVGVCSIVGALAGAPSLLAALLQRVGESQGFTAADDATQLQMGDCVTTVQKRAKALAAAKKEAQRKAEHEAAADIATKNTQPDGSSTGGAAAAKTGDKEYWTAGTGYSYDGQKGLRDFDAAALETKRQQRQAATTAVLALLEAVIRADAADSASGGPSTQALLTCIANSPVLAVLASFLRSTELDIAKQVSVHSAVYAVCHALAEHTTLRVLLVPADANSSNNLASLLEESEGLANDVLEPAEGGEGGAKSLEPPVKAAMLALQEAAKAAAGAAASVLAEREAAASAAGAGAAAAAGDADAEVSTADGHGLQALKDLYVSVMKKLTFGKEDMTKSGSMTSFKYRSTLDSEGKAPAARVTATKQQLRALKGSMPLDFDATVFLRHDKRRPYVIEFVIAAPPDTPYDSGLFLFHMYCDPAFPKQSPKVNLQTTGGGSVRFNPNLYASGKVCLSLLGTWHGGNSREAWTPDSTLLQVLVSIMALIFVKYPYYNEPGVEKEQGTDRGLRNQRVAENGGYERLRVGTVQWAMVDILRNPPKGFEDVVKQHFLMKRPHILETCEQWLKEAAADGTAGQHAKLGKQVDALKAELHKLGDGPAEAMMKPVPTPEEQAAAEAAEAEKAAGEADVATAAAAASGSAAVSDAGSEKAAPAAPLSQEAESLKMICPQYPDGMYTYALAQNKDVEAAALWLVEKGDEYFTANAEKFLS